MEKYYYKDELYIKFNVEENLWELLVLETDEVIYQDFSVINVASLLVILGLGSLVMSVNLFGNIQLCEIAIDMAKSSIKLIPPAGTGREVYKEASIQVTLGDLDRAIRYCDPALTPALLKLKKSVEDLR